MKSKTSSKKGSSPKTTNSPLKVNDTTTASIRKIENGYIVSESGYTGKGRNQQWWNKEYFSTNNPIANASAKVTFGKKK